MTLRLVLVSLCAGTATASAGGLFLPGAGAVSTSRAGASTVASDDGQSWSFDATHFDQPPPPTRYDIIHQEAAVILPSVAVGYRVSPDFDIGVRLSAGTAQLKSTVAVWGIPLNYEEYVKQDGVFTL